MKIFIDVHVTCSEQNGATLFINNFKTGFSWADPFLYGSVVCMATLLPACTPNEFHFVEELFLPLFSSLTGIWYMKSLGQSIKFWMVL